MCVEFGNKIACDGNRKMNLLCIIWNLATIKPEILKISRLKIEVCMELDLRNLFAIVPGKSIAT